MRAPGLAVLLLVSGVARAQVDEEALPGNAVSTAPVPLLFGQVALEYERALWPSFSLVAAGHTQLGFGLTALLTGLLTTRFTKADVSGGGGMVGARWYLFGGRLGRGFFAGPELSVQHVALTGRAGDVEAQAGVTATALTGLFGASLSPRHGGPLLSAGVGLTVGYLWAAVSELPVRPSTPYLLPALRLNVGWVF